MVKTFSTLQIQPLLRRDSNYYNLDAIKRECKWNAETGSWLLPPVMITRTKLPTPADIPSHKVTKAVIVFIYASCVYLGSTLKLVT